MGPIVLFWSPFDSTCQTRADAGPSRSKVLLRTTETGWFFRSIYRLSFFVSRQSDFFFPVRVGSSQPSKECIHVKWFYQTVLTPRSYSWRWRRKHKVGERKNGFASKVKVCQTKSDSWSHTEIEYGEARNNSFSQLHHTHVGPVSQTKPKSWSHIGKEYAEA